MSDSIIYSRHMSEGKREALGLVEFVKRGILRCETLFTHFQSAPDNQAYKLAQTLMKYLSADFACRVAAACRVHSITSFTAFVISGLDEI